MIQEPFPFFSVIVCVYNAKNILYSGERILFSCLHSLANQSYPSNKYEILIIDDESLDGSYDLLIDFLHNELKSQSNVRLIRIEHGGLSVARNFGIKSAIGEILAFIDQDAIPDKYWLEELKKPFLNGADFSGGQINLLNADNCVSRFLQMTRYRQFFGPKLYHNQFVGCNMAIKKSVFDKMGGFHENFTSYGDESTFFARIYTLYKYLPATHAAVRHKQPNSVKSFLRTTWKSSTLYYLCKRASGKTVSLRELILMFEQFLLITFLLNIILILFNTSFFIPTLIISSLAVARRLFIHPLHRILLKGVVNEFGIGWGSMGYIIYITIMDVIVFFGKIISPLKYRNVKIILPMTLNPKVLDEITISQLAKGN